VLWCFFSLLVTYLGGWEPLSEILETKGQISHLWPLCHLQQVTLGRNFLRWTEICIFQFVVIKPILALISVFLELNGLYMDGSFQFNRGYIYIATLNNISVSISLYYLVLFYKAVEDNLKPFNPLPKFLCIKAMIFLSFWQGIVILILVKGQWIVDSETFTAANIALFVNHFLVCIEMFFSAIFHQKFFGYEEFVIPSQEDIIESNEKPTISHQSGFWDMSVLEVGDCIWEGFLSFGRRKKL